MKNKIVKILGVLLTLATLSSLFIFSAPVGVSAATQAWDTVTIPVSGSSNVLTTNTFVGPMAIAKDGSAIYAASGSASGNAKIYKSTDGGRSWKALTTPLPTSGGFGALGTFTDIVCSSADANTVYITDGYDLWKSSDAGTTWNALSNLFNSLGITPLGARGFIVSLAVGYLGTSPFIFAATSTWGGGTGGAFVAQEAVYGMPWSDLLISTDRPVVWAGADVYDIVVDPVAFATTQMVMALAWDSAGQVKVTTKYMGAQWGVTVADASLPGVTSALVSGSLWFPGNFSSSLASGNMQVMAGVDPFTLGQGDVFLTVFGSPASIAFDLNIGGAATSTHINGISGIGNIGSATVVAVGEASGSATTPAVYSTKDFGSTWAANTKRPTGGAAPMYGARALPSVLVTSATSALVGTMGADCGVSISGDFLVWNTISLVNHVALVPADLAFAGSNVFLAANGDVWRRTGTNWERVYALSITGASADIVRATPDGLTLFVAPLAGTVISRSTTNGQTWIAQVSSPTGGAISQLTAVNASTLAVAGAAADTVYTTANNGVIWFTRTVATGFGTITDLQLAANGHLLAAGSAGKVARSTDNGATWTATSATLTAGTIKVAFANDYATSNKIFATNSAGGVWAWTFGTSTAWSDVDGSSGDMVANGTGIVTGAGGPGNSSEGSGMVYATDTTAADGVDRIRGKTTKGELLAAPTSPAVTFTNLWAQAGSVVLYTFGSDGKIYTYTDTLNVAGAGVAVSAVTYSVATDSWSATISWTALANAPAYKAFVSTVAAVTDAFTAAPTYAGTATTFTVTGLASVTKYYISVWAGPAVYSFMFGGTSDFTTPPSIPQTPTGLVPVPGAQNVPTMPSFQWAPVTGATSYELWLDTKPDFSTAQKFTGIVGPYFAWTGTPLAFNTNYYWQVRAVTGVGPSNWVPSIFTTVAAPPPVVTVPPAPTPTISITYAPPAITVNPPAITVTVPPGTTLPVPTLVLPKAETPTYIWAIVAVGALLTLAVIVLIIRTRRVV